MTQPPLKGSFFNTEFVFDITNHKMVFFDSYNIASMGAGAYKTLEVGGVDYQVPALKTLLLLGATSFYANVGTVKPILYQTDAVDVGTGEIQKVIGDLSLLLRNAILATFASGKYITFKNPHSSAQQVIADTLIGLEYTT